MFHRQWRDMALADLDRPFDVVIIGGGITGCGIFFDAAQRGLRVLLLEKNDLASGTSSRSQAARRRKAAKRRWSRRSARS